LPRLSGADSNVLARPSDALAQIGGGIARVQGSKISGRSGSTLAQASRALACAFPNVLTALADFLARTGLPLLLLVLLRGLRLCRPLILR